MIEFKKLKELIRLMVENDLTELDISDQAEKVTLKRGRGDQPVQYMTAPAAPPPPVPATAAPAAGHAPAAAGGGDEAGLTPIPSPMVGTFYSAASPDSPAFVSVGDQVRPDSVVCIIEAMKVFNEIKAETSGTIQKVLVSNGQAVEFGQPLYLIKPA